MKFGMYAIWDEAARQFLPPFVLPTEAMAVRAFTQAVNADDSTIAKHPKDYTLFDLGTWDGESGLLTTDKIKALYNGLQLILPARGDPRQLNLVKESENEVA